MYPTPQQAYYNAHPQFPYPANQYPTQATFASQQVSALHRSTTPPAPSYAAQSQYTYAGCHSTSTNDSQLIQGSSSSSSLACALDERVSPRHSGGGGESGSPAQPGFPDNEVVPYAPSPSVSTPYGSASPPDYCGSVDTEDESLDEFSQSLDSDVQFSDLIQDEEGIAAASSSNYDEQSAASSYGSTVDPMSPPNTEYETDTEVGYFNGQMVPLGLVGEYASNEYPSSPPASLQTDYSALEPPVASILGVLVEHPPFLRNSRSYTLAEAITPIEEQRPRLTRPQNKIPDASSIPTSSVGSGAGASPFMWQLDPSCQDGRPERACGTTASTPSPPPLLPPPQAPPRAKSPAKSQQGSTRSGPSAKSKMSPSSTAKSADEIQTEPTGRPGESVIKLAVNVPREPKKKPIMACLFCRERKIACGHPAPTDEDRRCNQCRRRDLECVFPKECRRGQHKRISRLARVNAGLVSEAPPLDELMVPPQMSVSPAPTTVSQSSGSSETKERRKSSSKTSKIEVDAERRAVVRLQRQMASMHQRRLG